MYHGSTKLNLTTGQKNSIRRLMKKTTDKRHYRRLLAVLQKNNGRTFEDIAKEHGVSIRSVQRWLSAYLQIGMEGLEIKKTGSTQSRITDQDREIILSLYFLTIPIFLVISETPGV